MLSDRLMVTGISRLDRISISGCTDKIVSRDSC